MKKRGGDGHLHKTHVKSAFYKERMQVDYRKNLCDNEKSSVTTND